MDVDVKGNNFILSAKSSLIKSAQQIPAEISQMHPNSVVHVSDDVKHMSCFRYLTDRKQVF